MRSFFYKVAGGDVRLASEEKLADAVFALRVRGAVQVVVACICGGSMAVVISQFTQAPLVIAAGALLWATFILLIDALIVRSTPKLTWSALPNIAARLLLATLIAAVTSFPLESRVFSGMIEAKMADRDLAFGKALEIQLGDRYPEAKLAEGRIAKRQDDLADLKVEVDDARKAVITEIEGRSPTGQVGHGPAYREKQEALTAAVAQYNARASEIARENIDDKKILATLMSRVDLERGQQLRSHANARDLADRIRALFELEANDRGVAIVAWLIRTFLVLLELLPLGIKLLSRQNLYEKSIAIVDETAEKEISNREGRRQKDSLQILNMTGEAKLAVLNHVLDKAVAHAKESSLHDLRSQDLAAVLVDAGHLDSLHALGVKERDLKGAEKEMSARLESLLDASDHFTQRIARQFDGPDLNQKKSNGELI